MRRKKTSLGHLPPTIKMVIVTIYTCFNGIINFTKSSNHLNVYVSNLYICMHTCQLPGNLFVSLLLQYGILVSIYIYMHTLHALITSLPCIIGQVHYYSRLLWLLILCVGGTLFKYCFCNTAHLSFIRLFIILSFFHVLLVCVIKEILQLLFIL